MSFWVSVWTPLSFAFSWAALNLASAVVGGWTKAFGLRGGCGFTAVLIGFGGFLTALIGCDAAGFA